MTAAKQSSADAIKSASKTDVIDMFLRTMETVGVIPCNRGEVAGKLATYDGVVRFACVG